MDLKEFYHKNIKESEYHYRFLNAIESADKVETLWGDQVIEPKGCKFEVYDVEEAIEKFRDICQPEKTFCCNEDKLWFYLITYYLYKIGYEIKEFPRVLSRPPEKPLEFTENEIRERILEDGNDENGTVRYKTRRQYIAKLTFELKSNHIELQDGLDQKFMEISNRGASFRNMSTDEKLAEIANLIENLLKKDGKFGFVNYEAICFGFVSDGTVKELRRKLQCFRHATEENIAERKEFTEEQKKFLIDYGITVLNVIHTMKV